MNKKFALLFLFLISTILFSACAAEPEPIALAGTSWQVVELNGAPLVPNSSITMDFSESLVSGNGSCNSYFGAYTQSGDQLTIEGVGATAMACVDQAPMTQEQKFTAALEKVASFSVQDGQLILQLNDGGSIVLVEQ
ncbi:MAG: META domain-containing protein [Anaerolineae bacterium]|jgi:heat shock protein HslJ|nr:META domain-containing protein [Anaerolineae bacterium]